MTETPWRARVDLLLTIAMAIMIAWLGWRLYAGESQPPPPPPPPTPLAVPAEPLPLTGAHLRGRADAPVVLVMYTDFECAACRLFERDAMPVLQRDYLDTGRVALAVRPFPLANRGQAAVDEVALAECAGKHGRFIDAYEALFASVGKTPAEKVAAVAAKTGLDEGGLTTCIGSERPAVERAVAEARSLGVAGTPSFFIGTVDSSRLVTAIVAHQGVSSGSDWVVKLLRPIVEAARP